MSVAAKKHHTRGVEIRIEGKRPKIFLVPKEKAKSLEHLISEYQVEATIPTGKIFPDLLDPSKKPGAMIKGTRLRDGLTQTELSKKLGITQADLSKMESGKRSIGKKMAQRLAKIFKTDYRLFL